MVVRGRGVVVGGGLRGVSVVSVVSVVGGVVVVWAQRQVVRASGEGGL